MKSEDARLVTSSRASLPKGIERVTIVYEPDRTREVHALRVLLGYIPQPVVKQAG